MSHMSIMSSNFYCMRFLKHGSFVNAKFQAPTPRADCTRMQHKLGRPEEARAKVERLDGMRRLRMLCEARGVSSPATADLDYVNSSQYFQQ